MSCELLCMIVRIWLHFSDVCIILNYLIVLSDVYFIIFVMMFDSSGNFGGRMRFGCAGYDNNLARLQIL